jgi:hypothetical protein
MAGHGGHGHGHGCCSSEHQHDHNVSDAERGNLYSLYQKIDISKVQCLNEAVDESCQKIFKPWHERLDTTKYVQSDVDEELLLNIPFLGSVKLKGVIIIGGEDDSHPSVMKLYKNRPTMTFDDAGSEADQEFQLSHDYTGEIEYDTKIARFNSVTYLSIHFPKNFGAETTRIYYVGLKGDFTEARRHEVTVTTYEARANPADHKTNLFDSASHAIH